MCSASNYRQPGMVEAATLAGRRGIKMGELPRFYSKGSTLGELGWWEAKGPDEIALVAFRAKKGWFELKLMVGV